MPISISKNQKGFGIVESMLASLILLFVLSSGFIILNSVLINITLENKRDEISSVLDERVSLYRLTGVFDDTPTADGIEFKKSVIIEKENDKMPELGDNSKKNTRMLSIKDMEKQKLRQEKIDKIVQKQPQIVYKLVNISAYDDKFGLADRIKLIERQEAVKDEI